MTDDVLPLTAVDKYGAAQLLLAASRADPDDRIQQVERVMRDRHGVPLLSGLVHFGLTFAGQLYGVSRERFLTSLVLGYAIDEASPEANQ